MKRIYYILLILVLGACSEDFHEDASDMVALQLQTPVIVTEGATRCRPIEGTTFSYLNTLTYGFDPNTSYSTGYNLSFYVCDQGTFQPHTEGSNNKKTTLYAYYYATIKKESFNWSETLNLRIGKNVDIYAYYPYVAGDFDPTAIPFTTNGQIDWMWAEKQTLENVSVDNRTIDVTFHHAMTCLEVRLSTQFNSTIDLYSITLSDKQNQLVASGTMDITNNGTLTCTTYTDKIIIFANGNSERLPIHQDDNKTYRSFCFIMPEKSFEADDLQLTFYFDRYNTSGTSQTPTAGRVEYTIPTRFSNKDVTKFETGKRYILNLMIDNTDLIVPFERKVDNWTSQDIDIKI